MSDVKQADELIEEADELIEEIRKKTDEEKFDIYLKLIKTLSEDTKIELLKWIEEQLKIKEEKLKSEIKED